MNLYVDQYICWCEFSPNCLCKHTCVLEDSTIYLTFDEIKSLAAEYNIVWTPNITYEPKIVPKF